MSADNRKIAVLTGGTDGMGRVVAPRMAGAGYFVVIQGRNAARGRDAVREIEAAGGKARFMACDLASLADIRRFAAALEADYPRIDVLINNAGIGTGPDDAPRKQSADGFELRFAVNYLAPFLLTRLLIDRLKAAAPARIVNVASDGQEPIDFSDVMLEHDYSGYFAYCRSKVATIMLTLDLAEELAGAGVTANTMHPGAFMDTTMVREMKHEVVDSVDEGANFLFELASDPKFDGVTGRYINRGTDTRAEAQCYDTGARGQLRALSNRLAGL
ncbi:MAG: SDR family NAD(P)-dependent oxidoreductase [Tropicimonas sp.]|uniref:SDR family NAD(P)-dependent oxidoreductase n=1 Tax=Tropicimonas sp. TaxID=2067044 RepID=UPI003A8553AA